MRPLSTKERFRMLTSLSAIREDARHCANATEIDADVVSTLRVNLQAMLQIIGHVQHQGHADNLVFDNNRIRVWVSRMTVEDGAERNYEVSVEENVNGCWIKRIG